MVKNNIFLQLQLVHDTFIIYHPNSPSFEFQSWMENVQISYTILKKSAWKMMTNGRQSSYVFKGQLENEQKSDIVNEYEILIFSLLLNHGNHLKVVGEN